MSLLKHCSSPPPPVHRFSRNGKFLAKTWVFCLSCPQPITPYYSKLISTITICKGILFPYKDHNHRTGKGKGHRTERTRVTIDTGTTHEEKKNDTEEGAEGRQNQKTPERIDWKKTQRKKNRQRVKAWGIRPSRPKLFWANTFMSNPFYLIFFYFNI